MFKDFSLRIDLWQMLPLQRHFYVLGREKGENPSQLSGNLPLGNMFFGLRNPFLKITEDSTEILFMWVTSIDISGFRNNFKDSNLSKNNKLITY